MRSFDALLKDLVTADKTEARAKWSEHIATVVSVSGQNAVVSMLGGNVRPLRFPPGLTLTAGDHVYVSVKGTSAMRISGLA